MFTSNVSILFAQSERADKKNEEEENDDEEKIPRKKTRENDEKQKNQISFCQLIQFLPNSHARTLTRTTKKEEDEKNEADNSSTNSMWHKSRRVM